MYICTCYCPQNTIRMRQLVRLVFNVPKYYFPTLSEVSEHSTNQKAHAYCVLRAVTRKCSHKFKVPFLSAAVCLDASFVMAVDWIGFGYAAAIAFGGFMGYNRKGSVMSLMAGLVFGWLSAYGAYNVSYDPKDIKVSLFTSGVLSLVMGMRYKKSGKLLPAGIMSGLSLLMVFRLLLLLVV